MVASLHCLCTKDLYLILNLTKVANRGNVLSFDLCYGVCGSLMGGDPLQVLQLVEHVLAIILRHTHAFVEVIQCRMGHLKSLMRDGCNTSQVSLITLVLEDGFLSQLNPVLLLKLLDEGFQELKLHLLLFNRGLDLDGDLLLHSSLMHPVACYLRKQFHVSHRPEEKTSLIELNTEVLTLLLLDYILSLVLPEPE